MPTSTPTKLATPNDLGDKAAHAISTHLNQLIADVFTLFVKTKNFHWHVSGHHYRDYHLFFDELALQIFPMIDVLAERVRKLGGITIHSIEEIKSLQTISDDNEKFVHPHEMIERLMADNKSLLVGLRKAHETCGSYKDVATTSILEVFIDETERRVWFLFETAQNNQ